MQLWTLLSVPVLSSRAVLLFGIVGVVVVVVVAGDLHLRLRCRVGIAITYT